MALTIISVLISFAGLVFLGIQISNERKAIRIQHSIDLSKEYADLINNELGFITQTFENYKDYYSAINKIKDYELKYFDKVEFDTLKDQYEELDKVYKFVESGKFSNDFLKIIANAFLDYSNINIKKEEYLTIKKLNDNNWKLNENGDKDIYANKLTSYYSGQTTALLNKLEAFSMSINTKIADEEIIYKSLHQTFIHTVKLLYPLICKINNKNKADKYYSHIIELYNRWVMKYTNELNKERNSNSNQNKTKTKF